MTRTVFYRSSPKTKRSLRKTCLHLGIALLLFYLGSRYYTRLYTWFISLFGMARPVAGTLAYEVRDLIVYSLRLLTPCLYLFFFLPGPDPIGPAFKRPKGHIFGVSIAVYAVASEIGSLLIQLVSTVAGRFGFAVYSPSSATPTHPVAIALYLVNLAVLPAFWEELLFRGYVLGALKRYGNFFALITSSLLFALLHGNPYQAVNAFMLGLAMGYFALLGGSIYPGMVVHFINNFMVGVYSLLPDTDQVHLVDTIFTVGCVLVLGALFLLYCYRLVKGRERLLPETVPCPVQGGQKALTFLSSVTLPVVIVVYLYHIFLCFTPK